MSEVRLSTQMGLKMILQCLPESPFRDTASRIIGEAVAKLDEQEDLIVDLNKKVGLDGVARIEEVRNAVHIRNNPAQG